MINNKIANVIHGDCDLFWFDDDDDDDDEVVGVEDVFTAGDECVCGE